MSNPKASGPLCAIAETLSRLPLLRRGQTLWHQNQKDWNLPLSRWDKIQVGVYLILVDYSQGLFPPTFPDQQRAYQNEINYHKAVPGLKPEDVAAADLRKPFWFGAPLRHYFSDFLKLAGLLEEAGIAPPAKLLELGCGTGWTAEFLTHLGFDVVSTTISPHEVEIALKRVDALRARGLRFNLQFRACPMETVRDHVHDQGPFDAVFVFEALHHAFDWKAALNSAFSCLRPGGWLLVCNEPNWLHTAVSYRVAKLSSTHEIGFHKRDLLVHLHQAGFQKVLSRGNRPHWFFRSHWLMAQR